MDPTPTPARLLIVPGLHDSGPAHWQSWLQDLHRHALRVEQHDWATPDLEHWAARIGAALERAGPGPWMAVAHSFGCLALARHLALQPDSSIEAALFVAPADPDRFGLAGRLPEAPIARPSTLVGSESDPWMSAAAARRLARRWGSHWVNLGDAGHINAEAGFGPLPFARRWVLAVGLRLEHAQRERAARLLRPAHKHRPKASLATQAAAPSL